MKIVKIILIIAIIIGLAFAGYKGYLAYEKWQNDRFNEINMLKANQDLFLQKITELSTTITHIVNDTAKTTVTVKPDNTYEGLKEQVIELKKDETANKDEIAKLREELSTQRKAFLASDDTILIKDINGNTLLLYRDSEGNLQPASEGIEKVIEHKNVSEIPAPIEEVELVKKSYQLKAGGYYSLDKTYGLILSKGIINVKGHSLNASALIDDFNDVKFSFGADIGYSINDDLELGVGYNTNKSYYIKLQYQF